MKNTLRKRRWLAGAIAASCVVAGGSVAAYRASNHPTGEAAVVATAETLPTWGEDLRAAMSAARSSGRDVLIEFAAPDDAAAGPSALEQAEFRRGAGASFVLVRLAPDADTSPARLSQITTTAERLGVARFPTFVLMDAQGKPYARSEFVSADPTLFLREFQRLQQARVYRDASLADAELATGVARATLLDQALMAVGPYANAEYADVVRELMQADVDNAAGLRAKYEPAAVARQADAAIQGEVYPLIDRGNYAAAIARIDGIIEELKPPRPQLQLLLAFKGQLYFTLGDRQRAVQALDRAVEIDPRSESAERARVARSQVLQGA